MIIFLTAVFFLVITPGPGVLSVAGVGSAFGYRPGLRYIAGLFVGNNLVAVLVVSGVAALVLSNPVLRTVLLGASVAYLLYLAVRIAFSGTRIAFIDKADPPGFIGGLILQPINPKAYAVNTTLFSGFPFAPDNLVLETVLKFVLLNAIWVPVHLLWLAAGITLRRLDLPESAHLAINVVMALSMLAVVALATYANAMGR